MSDLTARLLNHKERPATILEREAAERIKELERWQEFIKYNSKDAADAADKHLKVSDLSDRIKILRSAAIADNIDDDVIVGVHIAVIDEILRELHEYYKLELRYIGDHVQCPHCHKTFIPRR